MRELQPGQRTLYLLVRLEDFSVEQALARLAPVWLARGRGRTHTVASTSTSDRAALRSVRTRDRGDADANRENSARPLLLTSPTDHTVLHLAPPWLSGLEYAGVTGVAIRSTLIKPNGDRVERTYTYHSRLPCLLRVVPDTDSVILTNRDDPKSTPAQLRRSFLCRTVRADEYPPRPAPVIWLAE